MASEESKSRVGLFYISPTILQNLTGLKQFSEIFKTQFAVEIATKQIGLTQTLLDSILKDSIRLQNLQNALGPTIDLLQQWNLESAEEIKIFADAKFMDIPFLFAGYLSIPEMHELKQEWKSGNKEYVKKFILDSLRSPEVQEELLNGIKKDPTSSKWQKIIEETLWAHNSKKYSLSIPTLFPVIEGILTEKYGQTTRKRKLDAVLNTMESSYSKADSIILKRYAFKVKHLLKRFSSDRNPILHGSRIDYPSEELSAALILTVYSLDFISIDREF